MITINGDSANSTGMQKDQLPELTNSMRDLHAARISQWRVLVGEHAYGKGKKHDNNLYVCSVASSPA